MLFLLRNAYRVASILGIQIHVHYTWLIIFGLITWSLAEGFFAVRFPGWSAFQVIAAGLTTSLLFFSSVLIHELGHSLVAIRRGVPVRRITLFIFGGVAQIEKDADRPEDELAIAAAGPAISLALALLFGALALALPGAAAEAVTGWLWRINVTLAVFNLLPGFPLDGGRLLRAALWRATGDFRRATHIAARGGTVIAHLLILAGFFLTFTQGLGGLWFVLIGWFLKNAAEVGYRQALMSEFLRGVTVRQLMSRDFVAVAPELSVDRLVHEVLLPRHVRSAIVLADGRLAGIVTLTDIKGTPRQRWEAVTVGEVMTPASRVVSVTPDQEVLHLIQGLDERDLHVLPVVRDGAGGQVVEGIVSRSHVISFFRVREEIGL